MYEPNSQRTERHITQPFVIVGCLIGNNEGKLLLVDENGKWNLPAGWLELGERLVDGAKREAEEETGLKVCVDRFLGVYTLIKIRSDKKLHAVKFIFLAHHTGSQVVSEENFAFKWFAPDEIGKLKGQLWDPDLTKIVGDWNSKTGYDIGAIDNYLSVDQKTNQ